MIHHYITKYVENGKSYAEAWLQINILGKAICLSKRKIELYAGGRVDMNLLEHYVTNITEVKKIEGEFGCYYKVVADVDCYGDIKKQKHFTLFEHQWKQVQEKGYYLA